MYATSADFVANHDNLPLIKGVMQKKYEPPELDEDGNVIYLDEDGNRIIIDKEEDD